MRPSRHDRGFSLIEAMVASVVMLIGMLGLAGLQIVGMRTNNLGKRMSQASLLGQDLGQNMELWAYTDLRLTPRQDTALYNDTNAAGIAQYWDLGNATPTGGKTFDYCDTVNNPHDGTVCSAVVANALGTTYEGVTSPIDATLAPSDQTIFTRYWNVFNVDLSGVGSAQGKLVQIVVRWYEPGLRGYRSVTHSFFKYDPSEFNQ